MKVQFGSLAVSLPHRRPENIIEEGRTCISREDCTTSFRLMTIRKVHREHAVVVHGEQRLVVVEAWMVDDHTRVDHQTGDEEQCDKADEVAALQLNHGSVFE